MVKKYRPSNATEGRLFFEMWCDRCKKDQAFRDGVGDSCPIVASTIIYNVDNPNYPKEWTFDDNGRPICTAFEEK